MSLNPAHSINLNDYTSSLSLNLLIFQERNLSYMISSIPLSSRILRFCDSATNKNFIHAYTGQNQPNLAQG